MAGYENSAGLNVYNHYGPRDTGSAEGVYNTSGAKNEAVLNFDGQDFDVRSTVLRNALVTRIITNFASGSITSATIGDVDISGASPEAPVAVPEGGDLTVEGPTGGYVIVEYFRTASDRVAASDAPAE